MPDKKLTDVTDNNVGKMSDSEITIKGLKKILDLMLCEGDLQRASTISHTIDLFNRQKAEKERLNFVRTRDAQRYEQKISDQAHTNCILIDLHSQAIKEVKELEEKLETAKAEIERLEDRAKGFEKIRRAYQRYLHEGEIEGFEKLFKAEAYKECIEKVKEKLRDIAKIDWQDNYYYLVGEALFDNLLKELGVD